MSYSAAQYGNWSALKAYVASDEGLSADLHLQWATVSEFFAAQTAANVTYPTLGAGVDFVPYYLTDLGAFWSGYFTSRPVLKGMRNCSCSTKAMSCCACKFALPGSRRLRSTLFVAVPGLSRMLSQKLTAYAFLTLTVLAYL